MLAHYARAVTLMGAAGSGQLTKMVNQICIAGLVQALAEGINFAQRAGLDVELVLDVIGKGAAQSWQMDNRGKTMVADKFDFGFAVDWMRKDLVDLRRGGARQRRRAAGDRAGRPVLRARAGDGRRALGHVEPDPRAAQREVTRCPAAIGAARRADARHAPASRRVRRARASARRRHASPSTITISWVTSAVFASICVAEQ